MTTATATKRRRNTGITLPAETLKAALQEIDPAVPVRAVNPILTNVLFSNGTVTGSNLELQISVDVGYHGEPLLLPYAKLKKILEVARCDEITLSAEGSVCVVTAERGTWRLPVEDAGEWPTWEPTGLKPLPVLPAEQFGNAMSRVSYACDRKSSRYALGGVLFEVSRDEEKCWLVATDGRRLSVAEMDLPSGRDVDNAFPMIPQEAANAIGKCAIDKRHKDSAIDFQASASELVATFDSIRITARLLEGKFPQWRDIIKRAKGDQDCTRHDTVVCIEDLKDATAAAAVVTSEHSKGVDFTFSADGVTLHGQSSEYGESDVTIDAVSGGDPVKVKLDPVFVCEWLRGFTKDDDPNVTVELVDAQSACVLRNGGVYTGVIMPLSND
jgi:DNA polymerase-3 subunit beta